MSWNPWRWLWGLIPVAMLCWVAVLSERDRIETDLRARSQAALGAAGMPWAGSSFNGRDAILTGQASDDLEPNQAYEKLRGIWGVRVIDNRADLIEKADVFTWSATERDNKLRLSGFVPNDAARKTILGVAKATFPKADVDDRMKPARGAPPRDTWLSGVGFALKHLAQMKGGTVELEGANLSVSGAATDAASYKSIKGALAGGLPQGIKLKADRVTPPVVSPYLWSARLEQNQLSLAGHVPSEQQRTQLSNAAKAALPRSALVDRMELADGAPEGWSLATTTVVQELGRLEEGTADLRAGQLNVAGLATNDVIAESVRKSLREKLPASIKLSEAIKFKAPAVPTFNPFKTTVEANATAVILSGHAPSDAAKAALGETVKARLPGRRIDNRLEVGNGAPPGWQACTQYALAGLGRLGGGKAVMTNRKLELTGDTDDDALQKSLPGEIEMAAAQSCDADVNISLREGVEQRRRAEAEVRRKAEEDARHRQELAVGEARRKAEEDARRRQEFTALDERKRADEADARRRVDQAAASDARRRAELDRCQETLQRVAKSGAIQFERASADINAKSNATLDELAKTLKSCPAGMIEIEGHTDAEGAPDRNLRLSERRAQSVLQYLTEAGVDAGRLVAVGYGQDKPIAANDTADNRARNRRIEFTVKGR